MLTDFRAPIGWTTLAGRTIRETAADECQGLAAQLAFYFLLALFPALLVLVAVLSYLPIGSVWKALLEVVDAAMPASAAGLVREHVQRLVHGPHAGPITLSAAAALWSASSAMTAIIATLNRAYDIEERRSWWKTRLLGIALTVAMGIFALLAFALVLGGRTLGAWVASTIGAGELFTAAWTIVVWPLAFVLVVAAVDLVYHFAPNAETEWVWMTPGSLLATTLWLVASWGFAVYVRRIGTFNVIYGAVGSVVVLLLWFYVTGFALLIGAELDAEIDRAMPDHGAGTPGPGSRRRIGAAAAHRRRE